MAKILSKSANASENYLAKIVLIDHIRPHPNADKLQIISIDGNNIITDMTTKVGDIRIYFPVESQLAHGYLVVNNDYRPNLNLNGDDEFNELTCPGTKKGGFFEENRRVRAIKLRQIPSQGYLVPVETLSFMLSDKEIDNVKNSIGEEFDTVKDFILCQKYVVKKSLQQGSGVAKQGRKAVESKIIPEQFRFHKDTSALGKNIWKINPDTFVSITEKIHGSSFVVGRLLCLKPMNWLYRTLKKVGIDVVNTHYDIIYSSRRVIKNSELHPNAVHYYKTDIWGEAAKRLTPLLLKGETVYGEICGFTGDGGAIQSMGDKPYDYGCEPGEHKLYIYRITHTNVDGHVIELSSAQMKERCDLMGVEMVPILWTGQMKDKYPEISTKEHWHENVLEALKEEYLEKKCSICKSDVWAEGIVVRIEALEPEALKLKSANFLLGETIELDKGTMDIETAESEQIN